MACRGQQSGLQPGQQEAMVAVAVQWRSWRWTTCCGHLRNYRCCQQSSLHLSVCLSVCLCCSCYFCSCSSSSHTSSLSWPHPLPINMNIGESYQQLLDSMLQAIHQERTAASSSSAPSLAGGKVVIVSNFTSMLDHISQLLAKRGWSGLLKQKQQHQQHQQKQEVLRLDGSVSCELRQGLVERFNRASDPSWVFLLAAKGKMSGSRVGLGQ